MPQQRLFVSDSLAVLQDAFVTAVQALKTAENDYDPLMEKTIWAMGVAGEAGEVVEKWKKIVAYKGGKVSDEDLADLGKELGDVV